MAMADLIEAYRPRPIRTLAIDFAATRRSCRSVTFAAAVLLVTSAFGGTESTKGLAPLPARTIVASRFEGHQPVFADKANTMNPVEIVRTARAGYLAQMCEPWGMLRTLKPTLRFYFDDRILPWAQLKHHGVDGFDNNSRNL